MPFLRDYSQIAGQVRAIFLFFALTGALAVAGCAATEPDGARGSPTETAAAVAAPPTPPRSEFQRALDRGGVDLEIPARGKAILVNVPSYELIAFEDGEPVMRSRVIVGRNAEGDRTPELDTLTSVVRFRPSWRPTPMMVRSGKYADRRWPPGPRNPLGLLAIRLEPGMLIYLHGTNQPQLFERPGRALSSGCVRVERWDELAAWVLDTELAEVHRAAHGSRTFDWDTAGVPVLVRYFTEFPDESGVMRSYPDVYGRDSQMSAKLAVAQ